MLNGYGKSRITERCLTGDRDSEMGLVVEEIDDTGEEDETERRISKNDCCET